MKDKKKRNNEVVLKKILPTLIDVPRDDPRYMRIYKRLRYRHEKMDPNELIFIERKIDDLMEDIERKFISKKVLDV